MSFHIEFIKRVFYHFYSTSLINSICKDTHVKFFLSHKPNEPLNTPILISQHTSPLISNELLEVSYAVKNEQMKECN